MPRVIRRLRHPVLDSGLDRSHCWTRDIFVFQLSFHIISLNKVSKAQITRGPREVLSEIVLLALWLKLFSYLPVAFRLI